MLTPKGCSWFISTGKSSSNFLSPRLGSISSLVNELLIPRVRNRRGDTFGHFWKARREQGTKAIMVNVALVAKNKNFGIERSLSPAHAQRVQVSSVGCQDVLGRALGLGLKIQVVLFF